METNMDQMRRALELAAGRLELLLKAELPGSDHPTATRYVLGEVKAALSSASPAAPSGYVVIPRAVAETIKHTAGAYLEDWASGMADGTYQADIDAKAAYAVAEAALSALATAIDAPPTAADSDLERDAARWRALMSSQRMHFMGSSGFDYVPKAPGLDQRKLTNVKPVARQGEPMLFGMEIHSEHPAHNDPNYPDDFARELLTVYVDAIIARGSSGAG
jgi:hypothetical protein